jgi:hypothetical protein
MLVSQYSTLGKMTGKYYWLLLLPIFNKKKLDNFFPNLKVSISPISMSLSTSTLLSGLVVDLRSGGKRIFSI